jgi:hypothetical protein
MKRRLCIEDEWNFHFIQLLLQVIQISKHSNDFAPPFHISHRHFSSRCSILYTPAGLIAHYPFAVRPLYSLLHLRRSLAFVSNLDFSAVPFSFRLLPCGPCCRELITFTSLMSLICFYITSIEYHVKDEIRT